jgi:hypothetical protein
MLEEKQARELARHWVEAWNAHDLDAIMAHYAESVVLVSPVVVRLLGQPSGTVSGKDALRSYFARGLQAYPRLRFDLLDVMWGLDSVVLYYANQRGSKTGEFMELDSTGMVCRVVANYSA